MKVYYLTLLIFLAVFGVSAQDGSLPDETISKMSESETSTLMLSGCKNLKISSLYESNSNEEIITFNAVIEDDIGNSSLVIIWEIDNGNIISGQGTASVQVKYNPIKIESNPLIPNARNEHGYILSGFISLRPTMLVKARIADQNSECSKTAAYVNKNGYIDEPNMPADVKDLILELENPIDDAKIDNSPSRSKIILVTTTAFDPEGDVLTYHYTVIAGKIIGKGDSVKWDLTDVGPGEYTITAGVDDGCGICGKTITKTVYISYVDGSLIFQSTSH